MKTKLLPILLGLLLIMNGVLIYLLIKKPHENRRPNPNRSFLTEQLQFSDNQKEQFRSLDKIHRIFMQEIDKEIRQEKEVLFSSYSDKNINPENNITKIGTLEAKKEAEIHRFFSAVRKLCKENQVDMFDEIIKQALKGGERRQPNDRRMPPPRDRKVHPPR
ncbi:hypothetical protein [uncultured Polaribacter sp.]|uniref:hypothetical protein n=1 Tax=uncultured Polaribacter sp. TaxID=174711 RepID=UPI002628A18F|nr:hypothetical protein [uncultured Polaribacter sp.]